MPPDQFGFDGFEERLDGRIVIAVTHALNTRLRKTLGWQTPAEALERLLNQDTIEGVATTT
jgi:hypothetical protein